MTPFNRTNLIPTNWAIEHTHPTIDDEELAFLYGIAEQLNTFYGKRGYWYDPVSFGHSVFSGFRPVRAVGALQERFAALPLEAFKPTTDS